MKLGFVGLNGVRLDDLRDHYTRIIGLPETDGAQDALYFASGAEHHAISFHRSDTPGFRHIGLAVSADVDLHDASRLLAQKGLASDIESDPLPGVAEALTLRDPDGHTIYLYRDMAPALTRYTGTGIRPDKLGHVALFGADPDASLNFYSTALGFRLSDWLEDLFVFMRCNADHHCINFLKGGQPGLFHVAFELRDWAHVGLACDTLGIAGKKIIWGPGRHATGHNIFTYHRDPDGNIVELFADLDRMSNEALGYWDPRPHHGQFPLRPRRWTFEEAHLWGPMQPADFWD